MRLYHFLKLDHGLLALKNKRLKLAIINQLNDPFEHIGVDLRDKEMRKFFIHLRNDLSKKFGILCFSRNWNNPLLWSHYANKHKGLCLAFDIPDQHSDLVIPIKYVSKRQPMNHKIMEKMIDERDELQLIEILSSKFDSWSYEDEVRVYSTLEDKIPELGMYFADFDHLLKLSQVYIGANADLSQTELLNSMKDLKDIQVTKVRIGFGDFEIVRQKDRSLWYRPEDS